MDHGQSAQTRHDDACAHVTELLTARRCGDQCTRRGLCGTLSLFFTLFASGHLDHPFHSLLAHLLDASHPFRKDQLISQSVQALVRTVVLASITRPADPALRTKSISKPMPPKDKRLGISRSRFDTVVEIREDSIPRDADIPHTLRNVHHVRRDRRGRHEHKETRSRTVWWA